MNIKEALIYLEKVAVARGLSSTTLLTYRTSINRFYGWYQDKPVEEVNELVLIDFINHLREQGLKDNTIKHYKNNLINLLNILSQLEVINPIKTVLIPTIKVTKHKKKIIPNEQLGRAISTTTSTTNILKKYLKYRDNFIIKLFITTGIRVSELCNIQLGDIDHNQLSIMGKGNKERIVPLIKSIQADLQNYLRIREDYLNSVGLQNDYLFLSRNYKQLTANSVRAMLDAMGNNYGIENLHPHALRHSFATNLVLADTNPVVIQQLLGHESLATTTVYIGQLPITNLVGAVEKAYANIKL